MNIQDAYNAGLNKAEDTALEKLSKALEGVDDGPFENPKMEEFRQALLQVNSGATQLEPVLPEKKDLTVHEPFYLEKLVKHILLGRSVEKLEKLEYLEFSTIKALKNLMDFIYPRALKGHNGSKNYIKMISQIREDLGLTSAENVVN